MWIFISRLALVAFAAGLLGAKPACADYADASGTLVMNDKFHSKNEWGTPLVLPRDGKIVRVMDGTYGFVIKNGQGDVVAQYLDPQLAVGASLAAGSYQLEPFVCTRHRHHHVELSVQY